MTKKIQKIDILSRSDHSQLSPSDECYFFYSYTSHKSYTFSEDNSLISNLKKKMNVKGQSSWKYKLEAIEKCAQMIKATDLNGLFGDNITIVPIPPSKMKGTPDYDDRLMEILRKSCGEDIDYRELVFQTKETRASHISEERLTVNELKDIYTIDESKSHNLGNTIIIFDDVLTAGTHFRAMKEFLEDKIGPNRIIGFFIARRVFEESDVKSDFDIASFLASIGVN